MGRRKKHKEGGAPITNLTGDVSNILRAINSNGLWKNSTAKLNKTINNKQNTMTKTNKKNIMTEEDIDKLFNHSKSKSKSKTKT